QIYPLSLHAALPTCQLDDELIAADEKRILQGEPPYPLIHQARDLLRDPPGGLLRQPVAPLQPANRRLHAVRALEWTRSPSRGQRGGIVLEGPGFQVPIRIQRQAFDIRNEARAAFRRLLPAQDHARDALLNCAAVQ